MSEACRGKWWVWPFCFLSRERANGSCDNFDAYIKLRIASPAISFPARVVVQKALYRFVLVSEACG